MLGRVLFCYLPIFPFRAGGLKKIIPCYDKNKYERDGKEGMRMEKTKTYHVEGATLTIPLRYDEKSGKYMEVYPDFIENPVYTPEGHPIMLTLEDACAFGEKKEVNEELVDCGSCRFYRQLPNTLIGVCRCEKNEQM